MKMLPFPESFGRQTWALTKKNFTLMVIRSPFWTAFRALILPILIVTLLLEIPNLAKSRDVYGTGSPAPVRSLAQSMDSSKKLAIVQHPDLASDAQDALKRLIEPLDSSKITILDNKDQIADSCNVDYHGNSNCHAVITINDSPGSGRVNATWNYTIQADPTRFTKNFNVFDHGGNYEGFWAPLQVAIDNALTNSSVNPDMFSFVYGDQESYDRRQRESFLEASYSILPLAYFLSMLVMVYHLSSMMSSERATGLSQLVDAMGGGCAWPRVYSYVIIFDILYLPVWIIMGCLYWYLLVPTTNPAITIFWQILTGWALTSSCVFATAFFKSSTAATFFVSVICFLAVILTTFYQMSWDSPMTLAQVIPISLFFPSANYVFFLTFMVQSELFGIPTYMSTALDVSHAQDETSSTLWLYHSGPYFLWIMLVVQILVYPLLAPWVDSFFHGNNRRRRGFTNTPESAASHNAIMTTDLEMHYKTSTWRRIFCCTRKRTVKAVDGLNLVSQKRQILCLLGPNGSGKTTTLDMIAGFQKPTGGSININSLPSQIGVCPQKNVLWDDLTVYEHLVFWNTVKSGTDDAATLEKLITTCDLSNKRNSLARTLSGGMKRKLQLACMLVGGSSVCLMDEVTSGLDPISRRVIWNAVLGERSRRTMVFTTHFLDECEVLSDHIVIVSLGKMKCQGTPAELKNQYGAGYRVHLPKTTNISHIQYPVVDRGDRYICTTPDSSSAARLLATLKDSKDSENFITGPTIEDVFLKVSEEPHVLSDNASVGETVHSKPSAPNSVQTRALSQKMIFLGQVRALFVKRLIILRYQWWVYLAVLAIPLIALPQLKDILKNFEPIRCDALIGAPSSPSPQYIYSPHDKIFGPTSANASIAEAITESRKAFSNPYYYWFGSAVVVDDRDSFLQYIHDHGVNVSAGGLYIDNVTTPLIALPGNSDQISLINVANMARTGTPIHLLTGTLKTKQPYSTALPLWLSYLLFDLMFVLLVSICSTAIMAAQAPFWGIGHFWFVQLLYGLAATLMAYIVSTFASTQPAALAWTALVMMVEFVLSIITMIVAQDNLAGDLRTIDGTTYGLGLIFPIQNLLRAASLSLNQYIVRCRGTTEITDPGSFYGYGGPIFLLIVQIIALVLLLTWLDGTIFTFSRSKAPQHDEAVLGSSGRPDVDAETARVHTSQEDLLRMVSVSKKFGSTTAVENVSLGLREGEILALLGPNGAGKTTSINMIRGEIVPSSGQVFLEGVNVQKNKRVAQTHLGVCPQFDALDMLTVQEHLAFYARCKGVADIKSDVEFVLDRIGLTAHANKRASKLSGGQKRKLSLGIALVGNPPVLLLDEPSSAMDAASKRVLWKTLEAVAPGRSVLITTHSMEEADALATRAAIIARRLLAIGTTQELRKAHSNEYHVHLILKSAPLSTPEEMRRVADWVLETFSTADVQFEGENLGGQVRFIVPTDAVVPVHTSRQQGLADDEVVSPLSPSDATSGQDRSFVRYLIETLEANKERLDLDCYSIGAATMERVFLSVVKESDAIEEEDEKKSVWSKLGFSRK
ncbi:hypothetical protein JX266_007246 [Neoarthrinium moseri]|nr:hypothetical protein JX266_007246 [Neoarthrinium moseri]